MDLPDLAAIAMGLPVSVLHLTGMSQVAAGPGFPMHLAGLLYAAAAVFMVLSMRQAPLLRPMSAGPKQPKEPRWSPPATPSVFCGAVLAYGGILAAGASSSLSGGAAVNGTTLVAQCPVATGGSALSLVGPWPGIFVTPFLAVPLVALAGFGMWATYCARHGRGCGDTSCGEVLRRRSAVALGGVAAGLGVYMSATLYHQLSQTSCSGSGLLAQAATVGICTMIGVVTVAAALGEGPTRQ